MVAAKLQLSAEEWKKIEALAARARVIGERWMVDENFWRRPALRPFAVCVVEMTA